MLGMLGSLGGAVIGAMTANNAAHTQYQNQKELMNQQQQYNKELGQINQGYALQMFNKNVAAAQAAAKQSHQYNKDMWNYTNYENQIAHMKAAGLNPALMYGSAGQGGQTTGGTVTPGSGSAGNTPSSGAPTAAMPQTVQGVGMGIQLGNMLADIKLKKSQADLNEAEAEKKRGIDTELAQSMKELNESSIDVNTMSIEEIAAKAKMWGDTSTKLWQEARKAAADADYSEATLKNRIEKTATETQGSLLDNIQKIANIKLTEKQEKAIGENIAIAWYNAGTGRMDASTAADHVANELYKTVGELNIKEKTLLKDWIYQGVHAGVALLEGVTDLVKVKALIKAASKGIKEVITKRGSSDNGDWGEHTIRELFKE